MEPVLQVEVALVRHYVSKDIAVKRRIFGKQSGKVQLRPSGNQIGQTDDSRRDRGPVFGRHETMVGVRASIAHGLEDHLVSLGIRLPIPRSRTSLVSEV